ncbi:hypothetical protein PIROE2DRAFT_3234 [Piromyces sp. E2]|nr:hypothetical protein PIROE2DRAFT_3234 [Piromyces sp. E2]|eukprot:OUM68995.1 hypothetical protein PIROE2DRAFT_3234 [Piromyces sp. E2]
MVNFVFNHGDGSFKEFLNNIFFVDKTDLIFELNERINTPDKYICVTRPRRFGKTVTIDMLTAYYSYSKNKTNIFNNKKIAKIYDQNKIENSILKLNGFNVFKLIKNNFLPNFYNNGLRYLNEFNVVKLVMNEYFADRNIKEGIEKIKKKIILEVKRTIHNFEFSDENDIINIFEDIYNKTNRKIIILIDEWDYILRYKKNDMKSINKYLNFLNTFLKDKNYLALSSLNNFDELTMISPTWMAKYIGFLDEEESNITESKLEKNFNEKLIHKNENEIEVNFENIKKWYNGYQLKNSITNEKYEVYAPYSIIKALRFNEIRNYWNSYQNDMNSFTCKDDVFTMLIHLGYLGYNVDTKQVFIPNEEIRNDVAKKIEKSRELIKATWNCDELKVAKILEENHNKADNKTYNGEPALKYAILLSYYVSDEYYNDYLELDSGKGYADIAYIPINVNSEYPALLIELKYEKDVNIGMEQIKKRHYYEKIKRYKDNLLLVSINYDKEAKSNDKNFKHHTCKIRRFNDENESDN